MNNNTAITPKTIGSKKFHIPLYQRPYAWEEAQVEQLLGDLHSAFESNKGADYHIGILSVAPMSDDNERYDLIDGQQRITTLLLIGKAAKQSYLKKEWDTFLDKRLHLYGRKGDQAFLERLDQTECNPRMVAAFRFAEKYLKKTVKQEEFVRYIYEHAAFFLAEVPDGYSLMDKNLQFVRMNNRGRQLEKHEILKVQLLSQIADGTVRSKAFNVWNDMVDCLTGMTEQAGGEKTDKTLATILELPAEGEDVNGGETLYIAIVTVPEFLLIALSRMAKEIECFNTDRLLETFSVLKDDANIQRFIVMLERQTARLKSFFVFLSKADKYDLGAIKDGEKSNFHFEADGEDKARLIAVQSFLHVSTEAHHWLPPTFDWLESQGEKVSVRDFVLQLEAIDNSLIRNGKRNLSSIEKLKEMTYGTISHYWFYRIDYELWKRYNGEEGLKDGVWEPLRQSAEGKAVAGRLIGNFRFRKCGSIEHIKPQHAMEAMHAEPADDSFGNLALISGSRNSKFSNNTPEGKKSIILQSYTESLKMVHFLWCNSNAQTHGECMYNIIFHAINGAGVR